MSGHSKWSTIKRKKGVEDAKRGQLFTRLGKEITIAARTSGGDINSNSTLRAAVEKAKSNNMPKDRIQRAIDRGTGKLGGQAVIEATYEGYGPGGVAFLIHCLTDNKNRTVGEIRNIFSRNGGSLADAGSVAYIFGGNNEPTFKVPLSGELANQFDSLYDALEEQDEVVSIYTNVDPSSVSDRTGDE